MKKVMKIGTITYHTTSNFGAVLQSYALQKAIEQNFNCECDVIDYRSDYLDNLYKAKKITEISNIKELIKWIIMHKHTEKSIMNFAKFRKESLKQSEKTYTKENIAQTNSIYDVFITGSDQVWNTNLNNNDTTYFLDFVDSEKIKLSYAASFGSKNCSQFVDRNLSYLLKDYQIISVREEEAKELVKQKIKRKTVELVLDPTLLLPEVTWNKIINERIIKEDYIVIYKIADTPTMIEFARKLAKKEKCKVICLHNSYQRFRGIKSIVDASPYEFLNYIKYAKYVVTSSFHGICFSLIFHKNFYFELDNRKENNNSRIESLINLLKLNNRKIIDGKCEDKNEINYQTVSKKLNKEIEKSLKIIEKIGELYEKGRKR